MMNNVLRSFSSLTILVGIVCELQQEAKLSLSINLTLLDVFAVSHVGCLTVV